VKITCVIENTASFASEFYAEHGLSILIDDGNSKFLFDTGNSPEILKNNMELLNGFEDLNKVILSHGHDDHTGGLSYIFNNCSANILMHKKALLPKYVLRDGYMQYIGTTVNYDTEISNLQINDVPEHKYTSKIEFISKITEIAPNLFIFPEIPLNNDFEEIDPSFFVEKNGNLVPDNFEDELVMVLTTDHGLIILSGCAHKGIVNTVSSVSEYFNDSVYAVIGGTHLINTGKNRIMSTINNLKRFKPDLLVFGHCNGFDASCLFKKEFGDIFKVLESGKEVYNSGK
jgi:7,8-dihydropterin-6-yl-methyl-4-(beta-D-ribofuranosyl)aminobenzene 5'-phosphate synthase